MIKSDQVFKLFQSEQTFGDRLEKLINKIINRVFH